MKNHGHLLRMYSPICLNESANKRVQSDLRQLTRALWPWNMNRIIFLILLVSFKTSAGEICKDYPINEGQPFSWKENDFTANSSQESLKSLSDAVRGKGIGTCGLPNALAIVEGFILKQEAVSALKHNDSDSVLVKYHVSGFCEFLRSSRPCE